MLMDDRYENNIDAFGRREDKLLLLVAAPAIGERRACRIRALLNSGMDWDYLALTARDHGMRPLLYHRLNALCPDAVPADAMEGLRARFLSNAKKNLFLTGELVKILALFTANGITAVPYKGPLLALSAYSNLALREFCDLDVLVRRDDMQRAGELLRSNGYKSAHQLNRPQESADLRNHYEHKFVSGDRGVEIELHWDITPPCLSFPFDSAPLWGRLTEAGAGAGMVPAFSPEDTLLVLSVHASSHRWERLGWIADIAWFIWANKGIDWDAVIERAGSVEARRALFAGLTLANTLLEVPLPESVIERIQADHMAGSLADFVMKRLFSVAAGPYDALGRWQFQMLMRDGLYRKLGYCLRLAASPHRVDFSSVRLPQGLFPLYYALRPARLAGKLGRAMLGRLV